MRALHDLAASLKRDGVPIDGVGLQLHFVAASAPADLATVMADFAALGVDVAVTELDLRVHLPADRTSLLAQAADCGSVVRSGLPRDAALRRRHRLEIADNRSWSCRSFPAMARRCRLTRPTGGSLR